MHAVQKHKPKSRWPESKKEKVLFLYKTGLSIRSVAKKLYVPCSTIGGWIKKAKIVRRHEWSIKIKEKAILLFRSGSFITTIAQILNGPSVGTIARWVQIEGLSRQSRTGQNKGERNWMYGKIGKSCPNWKHGKTSKEKLIRRSPACTNWRLEVFRRDDFTCVCCGKTGGRLHAHHILSFAKYSNQRFNTKNGVTLCKNCHKNLHGWKIKRKIA